VLLTLVFVLPVSFSAGERGAEAGDMAQAIDSYVGREMRELHIPGLALTVIVNRAVVLERAYGHADSTGRDVTTHTPFILGSTSKALTAIAVYELVRDRRLSLDARVAEYVPWFGTGADPHSRITIRQLLSHTSGFSRREGVENWLQDGGREDTLENNSRRLAQAPLSREPGTGFEYSNANYDLLGYIIELVSGEPYAAYMRENVFEPLRMRDTFTSIADARRAGLADGFYPWLGFAELPTAMPYPRSALPSSFLISTSHDLGLELLAQLGEGAPNTSEVDRSVLEASRNVLSRADSYNEYASGWYVHRFWPEWHEGEDLNDPSMPLVYEHDGTATTYRSYAGFVPDRGLGVAMTLNTMDEVVASRWDYLNDGIMRLASGHSPQAPTTSEDWLRRNSRALYVIALICQLSASAWSLLARRGLIAWLIVAAAVNTIVLGLALVYAPSRADGPLQVFLRLTPDLGVMTVLAVAISFFWLGILAVRAVGRREAGTRLTRL